MPKVSKENARDVQDVGVANIWQDEVEGYQIAFISIRQEADISALLKGLPDDMCPCPHWGYVTKGRVTFTFADRTETFEAGDGFYVGPGHTPGAGMGTEFLIFSPAELIHEVDAVIARNVQQMQNA